MIIKRIFIYTMAIIWLILSFIYFSAFLYSGYDLKKDDSFSSILRESMERSGVFRFSEIVDADMICVFNQDDSDDGVAFENLNKYLNENKISISDNNSYGTDSHNIILFVKNKKGVAYGNKIFLIQRQNFELQGSLSEDIRVACHLPSDEIRIISGKLVIGEK